MQVLDMHIVMSGEARGQIKTSILASNSKGIVRGTCMLLSVGATCAFMCYRINWKTFHFLICSFFQPAKSQTWDAQSRRCPAGRRLCRHNVAPRGLSRLPLIFLRGEFFWGGGFWDKWIRTWLFLVQPISQSFTQGHYRCQRREDDVEQING